jgi:hypothetical protein
LFALLGYKRTDENVWVIPIEILIDELQSHSSILTETSKGSKSKKNSTTSRRSNDKDPKEQEIKKYLSAQVSLFEFISSLLKIAMMMLMMMSFSKRKQNAVKNGT